jgi:hypothetical protein
MPAKFNRVLGEQVDVDAAIQFLDHMVEMHMSESEGDDFLALMDRIVSSQTGKVFPMPIRSKTLKLAFLGKADHFFPLEEKNHSNIAAAIWRLGNIQSTCSSIEKTVDTSGKCIVVFVAQDCTLQFDKGIHTFT